MFYLQYILTVAWATVFLSTANATETAEYQFQRLAAEVRANQKPVVGDLIEVDIDLLSSPGFSVEQIGDLAEIRYRMAFNNIAEGWSWQPLANVAVDDYYRFKFLPLQSVTEARGEYAFEDMIGDIQQMKVVWRYDYFLAFENLYDFYPRVVDDDAGFVARVPLSKAQKVVMRATARLIEPVISESTTFWKAVHAKPIDFTLKKRYMVGKLETVSFIDGESGKLLQRLMPLSAKQ
jgi:hypothetical protein